MKLTHKSRAWLYLVSFGLWWRSTLSQAGGTHFSLALNCKVWQRVGEMDTTGSKLIYQHNLDARLHTGLVDQIKLLEQERQNCLLPGGGGVNAKQGSPLLCYCITTQRSGGGWVWHNRPGMHTWPSLTESFSYGCLLSCTTGRASSAIALVQEVTSSSSLIHRSSSKSPDCNKKTAFETNVMLISSSHIHCRLPHRSGKCILKCETLPHQRYWFSSRKLSVSIVLCRINTI